MKNNCVFFLTVTLVVGLVASCTPPPSTATATNTIPASSNATMILTPFSPGTEDATEIPTISPTPENNMVIEFLVDKSDSVGMYCGTTGKEQFQFVEDMIGLLRRHTVSSKDESKLKFYIGAAQFGTDFSIPLNPTNVMDINENFSFPPDAYGRDDTEYIAGIQHAISSMESVTATDKILIILTDGKFGKENIENIYKTIKPSVGNGLNIYIALLCPDSGELQEYVKSWYTYFDGVNGFYIFRSAEEAMVRALEKIKADGYLPDNFAVRYISHSNIPIEVPGYARKVTLSYWNTSGEVLQSTLDKMAIDSLPASNVATENIDPKAGCGTTILQPTPIKSSGILVITYSTFDNISISIDIPQNMLLNFGAMDIKVEVKDENTIGEFGHRRDCFDIDLDIPGTQDNLFIQKPCENNNGVFKCISDGGNSFYQIWNWAPSQFIDQQYIAIRARLISIQNHFLITQKTENIPVVFQATYFNDKHQVLLQEPDLNYPNEPLVAKIQSEIPFHFVKQSPHIYLFTSKTNEELEAVNKKLAQQDIQFMGCPAVEEIEGKMAVNLTDQRQRCNKNSYDLKDVLARACVASSESSPFDVVYKLEMYSFIFSECGFNTLKISWDENPLRGILESSLICEIKENPSKDIVITCQ